MLADSQLALPAARDGQLARWERAAGFAAPPWPRRAAYRGDVGWVPRPETLVGVLGRAAIFGASGFAPNFSAAAGP